MPMWFVGGKKIRKALDDPRGITSQDAVDMFLHDLVVADKSGQAIFSGAISDVFMMTRFRHALLPQEDAPFVGKLKGDCGGEQDVAQLELLAAPAAERLE